MSVLNSSQRDHDLLVQPRRIPPARSREDRAVFQSQQESSILLNVSDDMLQLVLRRLDTHSLVRIAATCRYLYYPFVGMGATLTEETMQLSWEQNCRDPCWTPVACDAGTCFFVSGTRLMSCASYYDFHFKNNYLGYPSYFENQGIPTRLSSLRGVNIQGVVANDDRRVAFSVSGDIYTWGAEQWLLGHGDDYVDDQNYPLDIPKQVAELAGIRITSVAAGKKHILAVSYGGEVFSWGDDSFGQCGIGGAKKPTNVNNPQTTYTLPRRLEALNGVRVRIASTSQFHSLVVTYDGRLYAFGRNFHGQLGVGPNGLPPRGRGEVGEEEMNLLRDEDKWKLDVICYADEHLPIRVSFMEEGLSKKVRHASTGNTHSLAVTDDGNVFSWGSNRHCQLGLLDTTRFELEPHPDRMIISVPTRVAGLQSIRTVVASERVSCAVSDMGDLFTWGTGNGNNLLGYGDTTIVRTPMQVDGIGDVVAVAFGRLCPSTHRNHTIVVTRDCSVFSIGYKLEYPRRWPSTWFERYTKMMQLIP